MAISALKKILHFIGNGHLYFLREWENKQSFKIGFIINKKII